MTPRPARLGGRTATTRRLEASWVARSAVARSGIEESITTSGRTATTERSVSSILRPVGPGLDLDLADALERPMDGRLEGDARRAGPGRGSS